MCGIAGYLNPREGAGGGSTLDRLLSPLAHRGPDGRGTFVGQGVALGMTRLAINDVEGGQQPYFNEDRSLMAVFNGEIYNFPHLRKELEARGHRFQTRADGEVIVHLFEEYGKDFVERLNGMYAIALWDGRCLTLYRDRMGIKPLYFTHWNGGFYFASELKALMSLPEFPRHLNHRALRTYLTLEYVPGPNCIVNGVEKLAPGSWLTVTQQQDGRVLEFERKTYWTFPELLPATETLTLENWGERLRSELRASVKRRLIADVPLGVFLSGGLDSSTLTELMVGLHPGQVQTFSVAFQEKSFDEATFAQAVAQYLGTDHHEQILSSERMLEVLEDLYLALDEPFADPAVIPTYLLSRFARERVKVVLSGEGADELFAGYPTYLAHSLARATTRIPKSLLEPLSRAVAALPTSTEYLSMDFLLKRFFSGLALSNPERHFTWMGAFPWTTTPPILRRTAPHCSLSDSYREHLPLVERIQTLDSLTYLQDGLLVKLDRATMLASLEGRVPFLDHTLLEAMAKLPTSYKLRFGQGKRVLRAAQKGRLPEAILGRRKKGFGLPLAEWLKGPLTPLLEELLDPQRLRAQGLFCADQVQKWKVEHQSGRADHRKPLWTLMVFQLWCDAYRPTF